MRDRLAKIRAPFAEVVVDVDGRDARPDRTPSEHGEAARHRFRLLDQGLGPFERQVIDDVNQQEGRAAHGHGRAALLWSARPNRAMRSRPGHCLKVVSTSMFDTSAGGLDAANGMNFDPTIRKLIELSSRLWKSC